MKRFELLNALVLILVAAAAYGLTLNFERQKPPATNIIKVQPQTDIFKSDQPLPDFTFTAINGQSYKSSDFKDKIIILNFWASWCAPCIKEFPHFIEAIKEFKNNIVFIGLSSDIDEESITRFAQKMNIPQSQSNLILALDTENISVNLFKITRLPETILIDKNGIMRTKIIGGDWKYEDLKKQIGDLLK